MANPPPVPRARAVVLYRRAAPGYDRRTRWLDRYRRDAVARLRLAAGATVIDAACGTGASFPHLQRYIGPAGQIIGIDISADMLALSRQRIREHGWRNVTLTEAAAEDAPISASADAALFSFTTDLLAIPAAVGNVLAHLRPAGSVAAVGFRSPARQLRPLARWLGRAYATRFDAFDRPWQHLENHLEDMYIGTHALGTIYIASGQPRRPN